MLIYFCMTSPKISPFPLVPLLILAGIFYLNFVSRVVLAPLLPIIEGELGMGHGEAGSLFFFIAAGYGMGLLGSGFISSRLSHRHVITLSTIGVGGSILVVSRFTSVNGMHAGLVLLGIFAGFYIPSGIATLTGLVSKEHWGKALAIHELAPNLGFITAPLLSEALLKLFSWRESLAMLGFLSMFMSILFFFFGRGGKERGEPPRLQSMHKIARNPSFWIMAALFTVSIGSSVGVYTMMPLFLVSERGMEREWANMHRTLPNVRDRSPFLLGLDHRSSRTQTSDDYIPDSNRRVHPFAWACLWFGDNPRTRNSSGGCHGVFVSRGFYDYLAGLSIQPEGFSSIVGYVHWIPDRGRGHPLRYRTLGGSILILFWLLPLGLLHSGNVNSLPSDSDSVSSFRIKGTDENWDADFR
jgi:hypothetical protein